MGEYFFREMNCGYMREEHVHYRCLEVVFTTSGYVKTTPGLVKTFRNGMYDVNKTKPEGAVSRWYRRAVNKKNSRSD